MSEKEILEQISLKELEIKKLQSEIEELKSELVLLRKMS